MARIRQILKHVSTEVAQGKRRCRRNQNHSILMGDPCLVIQDDQGPYRKSYCHECALPILKLCAHDLRQIRDVLYPEMIRTPTQPVLHSCDQKQQVVQPISSRPVVSAAIDGASATQVDAA